MKLWDINQSILDCIDTETGEILDENKLHELQMDRHEKLKNIAFVYLNATSDYKELTEQYKKFKARRDAAKATADWAKATLERELAGKEMKEAEFRISYRKSKAVEITDTSTLPLEYFEPQPDRIKLKDILEQLKAGKEIPGAELVEHNNIQIK